MSTPASTIAGTPHPGQTQPKPSQPSKRIYYAIVGIAVVIVVLIFLPYIFPYGPGPIERKCVLSGYVFAGVTEDYRVVNAAVEVVVDGRTFTTKTDSWGKYTLEVPTGKWSIRVKAGDNTIYSEDLSVSGSQKQLTKNIENVLPELSSGSGGSVGNVNVVYVPAVSKLSGYVFAGSGREYRLSGATVEIEVRGVSYATTTGASGEYNLEAPTGDWTVRVKVGQNVKSSDVMTVSLSQPIVIKEWYNLAPEMIPDKSVDGVRCVYVQSGWSPAQTVRIG